MSYDAIVIGGSYAGLTAALHIARARRSVLVIDAGLPRNRFSNHSHGVIAQDGRSGADLLRTAAAQVAAYPTVTLRSGLVRTAEKDGNGFTIKLADGSEESARGLVLCTGIVDELPDLPGLKERWGRTVLHCPYCHGYEVGGGNIGVLAVNIAATHHASLVADWGDVTLFLNGMPELDDEAQTALAKRRVRIERTRVESLVGDGQELDGVRLVDGRMLPLRALFVGPSFRLASPLAEQLGCAFDETPVGKIVRTDLWKSTTIPGVYAAGDMARMPSNINIAVADGTMAGIGLHQYLIAAECR